MVISTYINYGCISTMLDEFLGQTGIHADAIAKMEWEDEWTGNTKRDKAQSQV